MEQSCCSVLVDLYFLQINLMSVVLGLLHYEKNLNHDLIGIEFTVIYCNSKNTLKLTLDIFLLGHFL